LIGSNKRARGIDGKPPAGEGVAFIAPNIANILAGLEFKDYSHGTTHK